MVERSPKTASRFYEAGFDAEEKQGSPRARAVPGAIYGLVLGVVYALLAGTIDAVVMRDVPIRIDWIGVWVSVISTGVGLAALGAITGWPADKWRGVVVGAVAFVGWFMLQSFLKLQGAATVFLVFFLPLAVLSLPIAAILRWAIQRHLHNLEQATAGPKRLRAQVVLLLTLLGVGAFAGSWSQMPPAAQEAVRTVHRLMQRTLSEPATATLPRAFDAVPNIREHAGVGYGLNQRASVSSPTGVDVIVTFDDGYALTCLVEAATSLTQCVEGGETLFGPFRFDPNDQR
jgi:hypothetical protein